MAISPKYYGKSWLEGRNELLEEYRELYSRPLVPIIVPPLTAEQGEKILDEWMNHNSAALYRDVHEMIMFSAPTIRIVPREGYHPRLVLRAAELWTCRVKAESAVRDHMRRVSAVKTT